MLLLQSALKQLLSENLLDKFLAVLFLTVAYPGLSLGIPFFAKKSRKDSGVREPEPQGQGPWEKLHYTFRESLKHASTFVGLIVSSLNMFKEHQNQ